MLLSAALGAWGAPCLRSAPVVLAACRALLHTSSDIMWHSRSNPEQDSLQQLPASSRSPGCGASNSSSFSQHQHDMTSSSMPCASRLSWPHQLAGISSRPRQRLRRSHMLLAATLQPKQHGSKLRCFTSSSAAGAAAPSNPAASPAETKPASGETATLSEQQQQQQSASGAAESFINTSAAAAKAAAAAAGAGTSGPAAAAAASAGGVLAGVVAAPTAEYTMRQVSKHATDETCWIVVNGKVYDVTSYIDDHPGGAESILLNAGVDCTEEFMGVHSQEAKDLLERFVIGRVKQGKGAAKPAGLPAAVTAAAAAAAAAADPTRPLVALQDPKERYAMPLAEKRQLNHDTFFMRFALPSPQFKLGLPCGKHVFLCADIGGESVVRAYTPISGDRDLGVLDFLIKVYWPNSHPKFPAGGKMTNHLVGMKEGDEIYVKGPYGKFTYEGHGKYNLNRVSGEARYLSMVAGGSGVTPCYSVIKEVLQDPSDATRCALIYANKHEEDIWLREELDAMARRHPDRLHVWYVLEEPGSTPTPFSSRGGSSTTPPPPAAPPAAPAAAGAPWTFSTGFITPDIMAQHLLPPRPPVIVSGSSSSVGGAASSSSGSSSGGGSLALMCGPPGMLEGVVVPGLAAMGYAPEQMVVF